MFTKSYSLFLVFLLLLASALAQETNPQGASNQKDMKLSGINTVIVVTGSKTGEPQQNITQKVDVIYDDQIAAQAPSLRNIAELLQYQPGVSVTVLSRNDANWGSYGGLGPKYNSYLLDGLPIDSFVDTMSLDPWAFARIETHQGPASVMYANYLSADFSGNQAPLAGITNLILKEHIDAPLTRVLLDGGSWSTLGARFYHQDHKGNLHYFLGATYEQSDYTDYGAPNSWLGMLDDPSYQKMKIYGKATYFAGSHQKFSLFAQHTLHDGFTGRPSRDYGHNYDTMNAAYTNQVNGKLNLQLKTGFRNYDRRWGDDNFPVSLALADHAGVRQKIVPTDVTLNLKHYGDSTFTIGAEPLRLAWSELLPPQSTDPQKPRPDEIREQDVLAHGIRHITFLVRYSADRRIAEVLSEQSLGFFQSMCSQLAGRFETAREFEDCAGISNPLPSQPR
jgi:outer membrane receptor protein involved in Fe transport